MQESFKRIKKNSYQEITVHVNINAFLLQGRPLILSPHQAADSSPVPPPPKQKSATYEDTKQQDEEVLNFILPPRYNCTPLQYIAQ